ncbi:hypothetical protein B9Z19DRAFT_1064756 [Tuber borchii]|uniref:DUF7881 domain-containing protein n=1 Tax=Tuber borchii TaxID=42251 RepID=A0A2T6ZTJ1_TUBBO|nr:hypothetical protein B9Z19DRAFT_1064756 [Tuber borchii]
MLPFSSVGFNRSSSPTVAAPIDQDGLARGAPPSGHTWRNANIYDSDRKDNLIGGLWIAEGITNANLYSMLEIFCTFNDTFYLRNFSGRLVKRDQNPLQPGDYLIATNGSITVTHEIPLLRNSPGSLQAGIRSESFRDANDLGYRNWITVPPATESGGSINSPQNGILIGITESILFTSHQVSIDPDDNYKIVCFTPDTIGLNLAGRHLDQRFLEDPLRPVDQVLRWHFRQAVLIHVRGAGESSIGMYFPKPSCLDDYDWLEC